MDRCHRIMRRTISVRLQRPKGSVTGLQRVLVIAGRKDEGHAACDERVGDGAGHLPVEIDVEHYRVNYFIQVCC
jgi:hypothetical protein